MDCFTTSWYEQVIREYDYSPLGFNSINHQIAAMPLELANQLWLCEYDFSHEIDDGKTLFTTGIGLSGVPHMGTVSQVIRAVLLQQYGCDVQIVLGDVDAYTGRGERWSKTQELKSRYYQFVINMGFATDKGTLRSQSSDVNVLYSQAKTVKYFDDTIAEHSEEDLHQFYVSHAKVESSMTFRRKYSLSLMCSDFIEPLIDYNYNHVVVFLGIDEHRYVYVAKDILYRMCAEYSEIKGRTISALYSPIIKGFNGFPKMSKSFPESSISIDDDMDVIYSRIMKHEENAEDPRNDVVFQLMLPFSALTSTSEKTLSDHYLYQKEHWNEDKKKLVDVIYAVKKAWNND